MYATVTAATRSAGTASVLNNSNGNIRYYVNTTAGYTTANTTAYYLQLNTKAGGTTTVGSTEVTLVNAGQFVTSAVKAKSDGPAAPSFINKTSFSDSKWWSQVVYGDGLFLMITSPKNGESTSYVTAYSTDGIN